MSESEEIKGPLRGEFRRLVRACLSGITPEKIEKASLKDLALAAAIFTDKERGLEGSLEEMMQAKMREHYAAVALRVYQRHLDAGEHVTLDEVKAEMVRRHPHLAEYLPVGEAA